MSSRPPRPRGRRPGDADATRADILAAARRLFAERGFDGATIRAIADAADVDPALPIHHFASKRGLFVAAHQLPFDPADLLGAVSELPLDERGAAVARIYLEMTESDDSAVLSLLRAAATDAGAARMLREFVTAAFVSHAAGIAPGPDGRTRVVLAGAHMMGVVFGRHVLQIEPLASASVDELVALVGPTLQRYLDGTAG